MSDSNPEGQRTCGEQQNVFSVLHNKTQGQGFRISAIIVAGLMWPACSNVEINLTQMRSPY